MAVFLHTRVRVSDLDGSIKWYCDHLGFKVLSRSDKSPAGNQIVHLELPGNAHTLELTDSPDCELQVHEDVMHFASGVPDIVEFGDRLENAGLEIWPDAWREQFTSGGMKMAFITDPDGYEVEILERKDAAGDPLSVLDES